MGRMASAPDDLAVFYADQYPRVRNALVLLVRDRAVAEELAQEAFVRVCERWPTVRGMQAPGAWVHRVAVNLARSRFRRSQAERRAVRRSAARPTGSVEMPVGDPELVDALAALPLQDRSVLVMRFAVDLSVADTAAALGLPEGTVKTLTRLALAVLREVGLDLDAAMSDEVTSEVVR